MIDDETIKRVAADPTAVRRVLSAAGLLTMRDVSRILDISYGRVKTLRLRGTSGGRTGPRSDTIPPALPCPGDPLWHPAEIMVWGRQTGRIDSSGSPMRAVPTGRPRKAKRSPAVPERGERGTSAPTE